MNKYAYHTRFLFLFRFLFLLQLRRLLLAAPVKGSPAVLVLDLGLGLAKVQEDVDDLHEAVSRGPVKRVAARVVRIVRTPASLESKSVI